MVGSRVAVWGETAAAEKAASTAAGKVAQKAE
jgi:hypothetical protein